MSHPLPSTMVPPSQKRQGIYRHGILQIMITRACNEACTNCTQGSHIAGKPAMMTLDQFDIACRSLEGYWGVVGVFGGNPAVHPQFAEICQIFRASFPFSQRGIWTNDLMGKASHARITFNPAVSNINVHMNSKAADEIRRGWPEAERFIKGEDLDSVHSSPWVSMIDMGIPEEERWELIGKCEINQHWSALIGVIDGDIKGYFCEVAYSQAALHQDNPDWMGTGRPMPRTGVPIVPGWWQQPMEAFDAQVRTHCHSCGVPMRRMGQPATMGGMNEFSETHQFIARTKLVHAPVELLHIDGTVGHEEYPVIRYLPGSDPREHRT